MHITSLRMLLVLALPVCSLAAMAAPPKVVINEIHYHPTDKTRPTEFIELFNAGDLPADVAGWRLTDAISFTFPENTRIPPRGYLVVAQDPLSLAKAHGVAESLGPWRGQLRNSGEQIVLENAAGETMDRVDYGARFPWPVVGGERGPSIELINPALDNALGGHWRAGQPLATPEQALIPAASSWRYWPGHKPPAGRRSSWLTLSFDDSEWPTGKGPIGYGEPFLNTRLPDMEGRYSSVYFRKVFTIEDLSKAQSLDLRVMADDGALLYLNGQAIGRINMPGVNASHRSTARKRNDVHDYEVVTLTSTPFLLPGTNVLTAHVFNASLAGSSDFYFDAKLESRAQQAPTVASPGQPNRHWQDEAPPAVRQVGHRPRRPLPNTPVMVTARVTDPDGVAQVLLEYQIVAPGDYFSLANDALRYGDPESWQSLGMKAVDEGSDDYQIELPARIHKHRHLVRYRIRARDSGGTESQSSRPDDPEPNFAYFVYGDLPSWSGAFRPGAPAVTYPAENLAKVPVYHLLARAEAVQQSQHGGYDGSDYPWHGTLIYGDAVYDNISFRARGGVWRYNRGKNFWKFNFHRSRRFQAHDPYGYPYKTRWDKLNFSSCFQNTSSRNRHQGEQGLYEAVTFDLFNKAGVAAPRTHYVHFRIIDTPEETGRNQWEGDFHGLYLAVEQVDTRFLDEHDLPDGNLYKMEHDRGSKKNQGPSHPLDDSDLLAFQRGYRRFGNADWWRKNLDLGNYFSYRAVVEAVHHYDIGHGKNYYYYHNPRTDLWQVHPWDVDLTWDTGHYGEGDHLFSMAVANRPEFRVEYYNRFQEIADLLFNEEQTGMLIEEWAGFIHDSHSLDMAGADAALWNYHPENQFHGAYYQLPSRQRLPPNLSGFVARMQAYITTRRRFLVNLTRNERRQAPPKPALRYVGPDDYPADGLAFQADALPPAAQGPTEIAWRLAEVTLPESAGFDPDRPRRYEIEPVWQGSSLRVPSLSLPNDLAIPRKTYRARVRVRNASGYWSPWSDPVTFVAGQPRRGPFARHRLVISEIMYHPEAETEDAAYEYLVLENISDETIKLSNLRFDKGVQFDFDDAAQSELAPGETLRLASDEAAFAQRYGREIPLAGVYRGKLDNAGERLRIVDEQDRTVLDLRYDDAAPWPLQADGQGAALQRIDRYGDGSKAQTWKSAF